MRIAAFDTYGLKKIDVDETRNFEYKLYYTSDSLGRVGVGTIQPWVALEQGNVRDPRP